MLREKLRRAKEAFPSAKQMFEDMSSSLPKQLLDEWARMERQAQQRRQTGKTVDRADDLAIYDVATSKGFFCSDSPA